MIKAINATTYKAVRLGDVKPHIIIGGKNNNKFVPNINMSFHNDEYYLNIKRKDKIVTNEAASIAADKLSQKIGDETDEYYIDGQGRLKCDTVFDKCPASMVIEYEIKQRGLVFEYQDTLDNELANGTINQELYDRAYRPENVKGSYAVYCAKENNKYKTGKVAHIYRPFVIDSEGKKEWCILIIKDNILSIELPETFMKEALYPVRLDPTFGYESVGASEDYYTRICGSKATSTPANNGTLDKLSLYCKIRGGTPYFKGAVYTDNSGPSALVASNNTGTIIGASYAWVDCTLSGSITAGTTYWFAHNGEDQLYFRYDTGTGELAVKNDAVGGTFPDPYGSFYTTNQRVSIYATYTAAGGGGGTPMGAIQYHFNQMRH